MPPATLIALAVAVPLAALGLASGAFQVRGMRRLRDRKHVPSDEAAYLRNRYRRRLTAATVMVLIGGLIAGSYLSGQEAHADALGRPDPNAAPDAKRELQPDQKAFLKTYGAYWAGVAVLTFGLLVIAVVDGWATRRYWLGVYRNLRDEHNAQLRRDVAVYRQHKEQRGGRNGYGGRLGSGPG